MKATQQHFPAVLFVKQYIRKFIPELFSLIVVLDTVGSKKKVKVTI